MSVKSTNSIEVRFERLAEEFAPPAPKPEPAKPGRQQYVSPPSDIPRAQGVTRRSYPLTKVWVSTMIADELPREQVENFVRRDLAQRLAEELMRVMQIERDYDIGQMATRYFGWLIIADPKQVGATVEGSAVATGK